MCYQENVDEGSDLCSDTDRNVPFGFLLKKRAQDRAEKTAAGLQMALDNQNSWIYIIDPDDFHLIYINEKTNRMAPDVKTGMYCYEVFLQGPGRVRSVRQRI